MRRNNLTSNKRSRIQKMTSMCSSRKSHAVMNTDGYFHRPSPYAYQSDYYVTPRSTWSKVSTTRVNGNATWRFSSAMLIISSILVLIAVLAIAGLALWMAIRTDSKNAVVEFSCSIRITRGEKYNPMLKLSTSMVFREKERKFQNIFELLFRKSILGSSYKRTTIEKFENGTLKVFFRLYLDRKKIPRSIINVEDAIEDIIVKETYSISSLFKNMELDLTSISVKRINKEEKGKIGIINQKQEQQKHTMVTKNSLLRPNRTNNLILSSKPKTHTVRPIKTDSNEPDIDFSNIPTIKGTYRATKVNITAHNSTKGTSELMPDIKDTTKKVLSHEQITRSNKTSNFINYSSTEKSSISFTKSTTVMFNEEKLNEKEEDELKTSQELRITTTQSNLNIFKDFHNPDLETSPWKPIIPGFINTEFKLLSDSDVEESDRTELSTQKIVSFTNDLRNNIKQLDNKTSTTPSTILGLLESVNFHDISTIGTDITGFPRDRIVPNLTMSKSEDNEKPDIEVAGQLPSEMYNVRLKVSSDSNDKKMSNSKILGSLITHNVFENISTKDDTLFHKEHADSNNTQKTKEKFGNLILTIEPDNIESDYDEKNSSKSPTRGIGIAEPLSDTEIELETRNRDSTLILRENEKYTLRDKNVDINSQQPVYTSYNTPDLNGGGFGLGLIENSATIRPFRHTIPVDKITSAVNYNDNISLRYSDDLFFSNDEMETQLNLPQDKVMTPLLPDSEIIEMETFVTEHDDTTVQPSNYEQIITTEPNINNNERDDELSHHTTESYSDPIKQLIAENSDDKKTVSRNSTFIEIDIVKHTPGQSNKSSESYTDETMTNNNELKKVYNDTLKAYVVENLATLAPVSNNTGIDKLVQPKIDSNAKETTPLEQLFGMRNYMPERNVMNMKSTVSEHFSSHEISPDSMRFNEKESSKHKSTIVEQIVEIVTSISTKVSSNIKDNSVVSKLIITNSTNPIIRSEKISASNEADKLFGVTTTEKVISSIQEQPPLALKNSRTMQTSDKKTSTFEENRILLEKLKQLAEIRTDDDFVQITRNNSNSSIKLQFQDSNPSSLNIGELKKIANVMNENKTLKNVNLGVTLSRDGVEIFTKVLNKIEDKTNENNNSTRFH